MKVDVIMNKINYKYAIDAMRIGLHGGQMFHVTKVENNVERELLYTLQLSDKGFEIMLYSKNILHDNKIHRISLQRFKEGGAFVTFNVDGEIINQDQYAALEEEAKNIQKDHDENLKKRGLLLKQVEKEKAEAIRKKAWYRW